jgi:hypothetical protein
MKKFLTDLVASLNSKDEGFSGKKLSAFAVMICIVTAHVKWITLGDFSQLEMVLTIDFAFISTMFGIGAYNKTKTKDVPAQ